MREIVDDLGRAVRLGAPPRRIVSLVPSDTYTVARLGAGDRLVGRTDYCFEPRDVVASVPAVGGTKDARVADVLALEPDLVLANQEENTEAIVRALDRAGARLFVSFPQRVAQGLAHAARLARILGVEAAAPVRALMKKGYDELRAAETERTSLRPVRIFCPIWMDPLMTPNGETFLSDVLATCGAENVFADRQRLYPLAADLGRRPPMPAEKVAARDTRYPRVTLDEVIARQPEAVILPDEPHAFSDADVEVFRALPIPAARFGTIRRVSGKDLCWPGARAIEGLAGVRALVSELRAAIDGAAS